MVEQNYYQILGVDVNSPLAEIRKAYREKSRQFHPDLNGNQYEDEMKRLNVAYEIISDSEKRRLYDVGLGYLKNNFNKRNSGSDLVEMMYRMVLKMREKKLK